MQAIQTLAVVDRVVGKIKVILSGYSLTDWAGALRKATAAYNDKSHSYLMGSAPNDVKGSAELQYELDKVHGEQIRHNNEKWHNRAAKLRDAGGFRLPRPRESWERIDAPKFDGTVRQVAGFKDANVEDAEGNSFPVKTVLAVPAGSQDVDIGIEAGPGGGRRARQREMLQDYARNLKGMLPSTGHTLARVAQLLRGMRGFTNTTEAYGPAKAGRIVSFLKLYPRLFALQGSGPGIKVSPAAPPPPQPTRPRPVQVGGASSSSAAPPRERAERALEIDPRAPYRRFPNEQKVRYKEANPARAGTMRHARYEAYKTATTIGEARRLRATSLDISLDVQRGALTLL